MATKDKYAMIPLPEGIESMTRIILKVEPWDGVVFQFGKVSFDEAEIKLYFEYQVFNNPNGVDTNSREFRDLLFEILVEVMELACRD